MTFARCKPNKTGLVVLDGKPIRISPGWEGDIPSSLLPHLSFLEPCAQPVMEVRRSEDFFR